MLWDKYKQSSSHANQHMGAYSSGLATLFSFEPKQAPQKGGEQQSNHNNDKLTQIVKIRKLRHYGIADKFHLFVPVVLVDRDSSFTLKQDLLSSVKTYVSNTR